MNIDNIISLLIGAFIGTNFGFLVAGLMWGTDNDDLFD